MTYATHRNEVVAVIFGFGSLVSKESRDKTVKVLGSKIGKLHHMRRVFNAVGQWNNPNNTKYFTSIDVAGKAIRDEHGHELLPRFMPTYLNVVPEIGATTMGVFIPVTKEQLQAFDAREVNYLRQDVTHLVDKDVELVHDVPVYTYVAKTHSQMRVTQAGAYIPKPYWDSVITAFAAEGLEEDFRASTDVPVEIINVGLAAHLSEY